MDRSCITSEIGARDVSSLLGDPDEPNYGVSPQTSSRGSWKLTSTIPSKVLTDKFNSLQDSWCEHKAMYPLKILSAKWIREANSIDSILFTNTEPGKNDCQPASPDVSSPNRLPQRPNRKANKSYTVQQTHVDDELSVGASTVSTLSSTESVFDRLYKQVIRSPRRPRSSLSAPEEERSFMSPVKRKPRARNHLKAYESRSCSGSVTYDRTPRRRGRAPSYFFTKGFGGLASENTTSVYERLYRNKKRQEKIWTKPPRYSPSVQTRNYLSHQSISVRDVKDSQETELDLSLHSEPIPSIASLGTAPPITSDSVVKTLEDDMETVGKTCKQLGVSSDNDCSPTVTAASLSTNEGAISPIDGPHEVVNLLAPHDVIMKEDISTTKEVRKELEGREEDHRQFLGWDESVKSYRATQLHSHIDKGSSNTVPRLYQVSHDGGDIYIRTKPTNAGAASIGFFTLHDSSVAERIRQFHPPIHRRQTSHTGAPNEFNLMKSSVISCSDVRPSMTLRRLRDHSSIIIQRSWRAHLDEVKLATSMIRAWNMSLWYIKIGNDSLDSSTRRRAISKALRIVGSWWILEGSQWNDDLVTVMWENKFSLDGKVIRLMLECEVNLVSASVSKWDRRKLAMLLLKSGLKRARIGEQNASRIQRWYREVRGERSAAATILQAWIKKSSWRVKSLDMDLASHEINIKRECTTTKRMLADNCKTECSETLHEGIEEPLLESSAHSERISKRDHAAAITIQSWLRIHALRLAVKDSPSPSIQPKSTFKSARGQSDELDALGNCLQSSVIRNKRFDGSHFCRLESTYKKSCVAERAAALAIHNIVRAYIAGLKKCRINRNASLIQATVRLFLVRKKVESQHLAAVIIQFAWGNYQYFKMKIKYALIIQRFWRMAFCRRNFTMLLFCIVFLQSKLRRALAMKRMALKRQATLLIQRMWRGSRVKQPFLNLKASVAILQSTFKQKRRIELYVNQHSNALVIQSRWRSYIAQIHRRKWLNATILLQSVFRQVLQTRRFLNDRRNAVVIQRSWRKLLWNRDKSAVKSQYQYRQAECRNLFCRRLDAAVLLQCVYRGALARYRWKTIVVSATLIQAVSRMFRAKQALCSKQCAVILIQSVLRKMIARNRLSMHRIAAMDIQRLWRANKARRIVGILNWTRANSSATKIQTFWRTSIIRGVYKRRIVSAVSIQSFFRMCLSHRDCQEFLSKKEKILVAITIQKAKRDSISRFHRDELFAATVTTQSERCGAIERHCLSATIIQRLWRERTSTQSKIRQCASAITVQSFWRGRSSRSTYKQLRNACITIQSAYRDALCMRWVLVSLQERARLKTIHACVGVQAFWRGRIAKGHFQRTLLSVRTIQTYYRMSSCRSRYHTMRPAALLVQNDLRGNSSRRDVDVMDFSKTRNQSSWKVSCSSCSETPSQRRLHAASTRIQIQWRWFLAQDRSAQAKNECTVLQRPYQKPAGSSQLFESRTELFEATNSPSATAEKNSNEEEIVGRISHEIPRRYARSAACVVIQKHLRGTTEMDDFAHTREALIVVQALTRGFLTRKTSSIRELRQFRAATVLQRSLRGHIVRSTLDAKWACAIRLQSCWRRGHSLAEMKAKRNAIKRVQCWFRVVLLRESARNILLQRQQCCHYYDSLVTIQAFCRGSIAREFFRRFRVGTIAIQAVFRGFRCRTQWWFVRSLVPHKYLLDAAAGIIQVAFSIWKLELAVWEMKSLAVLLQRGVRAQLDRSVVRYALLHLNMALHSDLSTSTFRLAKRHEKGLYVIKRWHKAVALSKFSAAIVIQRFIRGSKMRTKIRRDLGFSLNYCCTNQRHCIAGPDTAPRSIQRTFRSQFKARLYNLMMIQRVVRRWIARKQLRTLVRSQKLLLASSIRLQAFLRGNMARLIFQRHQTSAVILQNAWRCYSAKSDFRNVQAVVSLIQRWFRKRMCHQTHRGAIVCIQSAWRMSRARTYCRERMKMLRRKTEETEFRIHAINLFNATAIADNMLAGTLHVPCLCMTRLASKVSAALVEAEASSAGMSVNKLSKKCTVPVP